MADNSLLPVVVGGLLTISGGIVASGVTIAVTLLQVGEEKKKRRAEKFEELVAAVYAFDHWLAKKEEIQAHGVEGKLDASPFAKIEAIAAVYFPTFVGKVAELQLTVRAYENWIAQAWGKRVAGKVDHINDGLLDVYNPYMQRRDELLDNLRIFAVDHFQNDELSLFKKIENWVRGFFKK